jgi:hypothetical protein
MSYENSKLFTESQKDMRMVVLSIVARQESAGWPIKQYLRACINFDIDFIESYDAKIAEENKAAEIKTQLFWENIRSAVEEQNRVK